MADTRLNDLADQIAKLQKEREAVAVELNEVLVNYDHNYNPKYYFPNIDCYAKFYGLQSETDHLKWVEQSNTFPTWMSSGDMN